MVVEFYACITCGKVTEIEILKKTIVCTKCSGKKVRPIRLGVVRLMWFVLTHPNYLLQALRGH